MVKHSEDISSAAKHEKDDCLIDVTGRDAELFSVASSHLMNVMRKELDCTYYFLKNNEDGSFY